jgi:DNA-binding MarR family transcriptional regulator
MAWLGKNYITREINPADRRNMKVSLSAKGIVLVQQLNKAYINIHKEILQDIDESQHRNLISAMTQLFSALEKWIAKS